MKTEYGGCGVIKRLLGNNLFLFKFDLTEYKTCVAIDTFSGKWYNKTVE